MRNYLLRYTLLRASSPPKKQHLSNPRLPLSGPSGGMKRVPSVSDQCDQLEQIYRDQNYARVGVMCVFRTLDEFEANIDSVLARCVCVFCVYWMIRGLETPPSRGRMSFPPCVRAHICLRVYAPLCTRLRTCNSSPSLENPSPSYSRVHTLTQAGPRLTTHTGSLWWRRGPAAASRALSTCQSTSSTWAWWTLSRAPSSPTTTACRSCSPSSSTSATRSVVSVCLCVRVVMPVLLLKEKEIECVLRGVDWFARPIRIGLRT